MQNPILKLLIAVCVITNSKSYGDTPASLPAHENSVTLLNTSEIESSSSQNENPEETTPIATAPLIWKKADLTHYESYPDPGSEECLKYNGCQWEGMFAALDGKQTEAWVKANNIIAVHSKDFTRYKLKTLRLKKGTRTIDAKVYDMCADSDCDGCCTDNASETGFLIDIEKYTKARFNGIGQGVIEWTCLDCPRDLSPSELSPE